MESKTEKFIKKAKKIHGDKYNYSKVEYIKSCEKIIIICPIHGEFEQRASNHLLGINCKKCGNNTLTKNQWIEKAKKIHGDKYDYSKVKYIKSSEKIIIICSIHGEFEQQPRNHLSGNQCNKCGNNTPTKNQWIEKAKLIHDDKYDYSKSEYTHSENLITIICPEHGEFEQLAYNHLSNRWCIKCGIDKTSKLKTSNTLEWIEKANIVHENKYSYHKVDYKHSEEKIIIHCTEEDKNGLVHGDFEQQPNSHLQGTGCPKCALKYNIQETEVVDFIKSLNIENIVNNDRTILNGKEIDIYLPDYKLAIEYNGLHWHSENQGKDNKYHLEKTELCLKKGIQLIHIFEDEWVYKKEIVKSRLLYQLNKIDKDHIAYGRNCFVKEINDKTITRNFLERNHIQGFVGSKVDLGLYININNTNGETKEYLLSIMTFGGLRKSLGNSSSEDCYELLRFCNAINYSVIGGASKLLKYFESHYKPEKIISYADRRWSKGNLYEQLNFQQIKVSSPNYFYISGQKRLHRFNFRKDILISKYGCSPEDTENNFTKTVLGLNRIYDCGTLVYEKQITD